MPESSPTLVGILNDELGHDRWQDPAALIATAGSVGVVKIGMGLAVAEDGSVSAPIATTEAVGMTKPDGTTLTIDEDGTLHVVDDDSAFLTTGLLESDSTDITPGHIVTADDTRLSDHRYPTIGFSPLTDGALADSKLIFAHGDCIMVPFTA